MSATCNSGVQTLSNNAEDDFQSTMSATGAIVTATRTNLPSTQLQIDTFKSSNQGQNWVAGGSAVKMSDFVAPPANATIVQGDLVCDENTGMIVTVVFIGIGTTTAGLYDLYVRTSQDGGSLWNNLVKLEGDANLISDVHAKKSIDGVRTEIIYTLQKSALDPMITKTQSTNVVSGNSGWTAREVPNLATASNFPQITASDNGDIVWSTFKLTGGAVVVYKRATFAGAWALSTTMAEVDSTFPRISCSSDGLHVAVSYYNGGGPTSFTLRCRTTDDGGATWPVATLMSDAGATSLVTPFFAPFEGNHNVVVSRNSNVINVVWISNNTPDAYVRTKTRMLGTWAASQIIFSPGSLPTLGFPKIVSSTNGAVENITFSRLEGGNVSVYLATTSDGGVTWPVPSVISVFASTTRTRNNQLNGSYVGNVINVMWNFTGGGNSMTDYWRNCVASSNAMVVTRTFNPISNFYSASGQQMTYSFTLGAFANSDYQLSQLIDNNIMENSSGPAKDAMTTPALVGVTFVQGTNIGSSTSGFTLNNDAFTLTFTSTLGNLVWSSTSIPTIINVVVTFDITNFGSPVPQVFYDPPDNVWTTTGGQWSNTSSLVPLISSPGTVLTSTTGTLAIGPPICVAEGSLVNLINGDSVSIENLRPGDFVLGENNRPVLIEKLIKLNQPIREFVKLNYNDANLLICQNHPILIDGVPVMPQEIGEMICLPKPKYIYTLVTPARQYVQIGGFLVATWSTGSWLNFTTNDPRGMDIDWSHIN